MATIVPTGSPKKPKPFPTITQDKTNKALKDGNFTKFIPSGGKLYLSGAEKYWAGSAGKAGQPDMRYNLQWRIAGTPDNFRMGLPASGFSQQAIETIINESISSNNYQTTMKAAYDREILAKKAKAPEEIIPIDEIISLVETTIKGKKAAPAVKTVAGRKSTRGDTLRARVQAALEENKTIRDDNSKFVIDVSVYDPVKQTGARKITRGKLPKNRLRVSLNDLPLTAKELAQYQVGLNTLTQQGFQVDTVQFMNAARQAVQALVGAPVAGVAPVRVAQMQLPTVVPAGQVQLPVIQAAGGLGLLPVVQPIG